MHTLSVKGDGGCFVIRKGVTKNKSIHLDSRYSDLSLKLALHSLIEDIKVIAEIEVTKAYHAVRTGDDLMESYYIIQDNLYNQLYYPNLIGVKFLMPPVDASVLRKNDETQDIVYKDFEDWREKTA